MLTPPFYVISDTHWYHKNIVKYCNRDMNHDQIMFDRWAKTIDSSDVVLHLGDLILTRNGEQRRLFRDEIAPSLPGQKFLILGNHDRETKKFYTDCGFTILKPFMIRYRGFEVSFDHYPTEKGLHGQGEQHIRVHGHIHNSGYQHIHAKRKEKKRYGNINVSVEMIDYTPQSIERLLDRAIANMKPRQPYVNRPR